MSEGDSRAASRGSSSTTYRCFLFADLRGYTAFLERAGNAAGVALLDDYLAITRAAVAQHHGAEIKTEGGRWKKDVKQVRLAVEGADVQMIKVVLGWDNRADDTLAVGTIKAGGMTAPKDAPGRKGRLTSVKMQYKILGKAPTATVKIMGLD